MKKNTVKIAIIIMIIIVGVVGLYAYLSTKQRNAMAEAQMTKVQIVLSRDLQKDYPPTVKQVMSYFNEIQECLYKEECTEEEIERLGMQARLLYDEELLENNEVAVYLTRLKSEVNAFREAKRKLYKIYLAASNNVETFQEDGYEFARISCNYYFSENGTTIYQDMIYLLRRDENRRWKIYGWDRAANVNTGE